MIKIFAATLLFLGFFQIVDVFYWSLAIILVIIVCAVIVHIFLKIWNWFEGRKYKVIKTKG